MRTCDRVTVFLVFTFKLLAAQEACEFQDYTTGVDNSYWVQDCNQAATCEARCASGFGTGGIVNCDDGTDGNNVFSSAFECNAETNKDFCVAAVDALDAGVYKPENWTLYGPTFKLAETHDLKGWVFNKTLFTEVKTHGGTQVSGIALEIVQEIGKLANFNFVPAFEALGDKSEDEKLFATLPEYHFGANYFIDTKERRDNGVSVGLSWFNADMHVVYMKKPSSAKKQIVIFGLLQAFDDATWWLILTWGIMTFVFSFVYSKCDVRRWWRHTVGLDNARSIFHLMNQYMIAGLLALKFVQYEGNFITGGVADEILLDKTLDEMLATSQFCIERDNVVGDVFLSNYPQTFDRLTYTTSDRSAIDRMIDNQCEAAILSKESFELLSKEYCNIEMFSLPVAKADAGLAFDTTSCGQNMRYLFDYHLENLIQDGTVDSIRQKFYEPKTLCAKADPVEEIVGETQEFKEWVWRATKEGDWDVAFMPWKKSTKEVYDLLLGAYCLYYTISLIMCIIFAFRQGYKWMFWEKPTFDRTLHESVILEDEFSSPRAQELGKPRENHHL